MVQRHRLDQLEHVLVCHRDAQPPHLSNADDNAIRADFSATSSYQRVGNLSAVACAANQTWLVSI